MRRRLIVLVAAAISLVWWLPANPAQAVPTIVPATRPASVVGYLAVGDSIPAGVGVGESHAYPAILDHLSRRLELVEDLAVSGATVTDVTAQLAAVPEAGRASIRRISLTVGANDIGWGAALALCVNAPAECADTVVDPSTGATLGQAIGVAVAGLSASLPALLARAHQWYPNATIYVSSYYRLFGSKAKDCVLADGAVVSAGNQAWLNSTADRLNATIRRSVASVNASGPARVARYVNAAQLFRGHGFCDKGARWVFGPIEVALGVDAAAIAHPNYRGQAAYALAFLRARIA